jgi:mannitol/fructose-specific phosphotransferase system IIA component
MIELGTENIKLHAQAADKTDAIRQGGQLLVDNGYMQPGYIDSMLAREKVANTYLGNGIAIPHGLPKDRELILRTGISVTQKWGLHLAVPTTPCCRSLLAHDFLVGFWSGDHNLLE